MRVRDAGISAIERYRVSRFHDRTAGCCRFTPTCSHYAEDALRRRALPVALLLIVWRILRCNPLTAYGTVDRVGPRDPRRVRRVLAVLGLAGITTLFVASTASAAATLPPPAQSGFGPTAGGCTASVGGRPINTLDSDHPLQVHKGQGIVLTGRAPASVAGLGIQLRSVTNVKIHFIEKLATRTETHTADGQSFQRAVNVNTYLKYGSGVYRVDVHSVAPGAWDCTATFYVEMHGSKLAAETAIVIGGIGAVGVALSAGSGEPSKELPPKPDDDGVYDPTIAPDKLEEAQVRRDRAANAKATTTVGCLAAILFVLIASTGAFATVPAPAVSRPDPRRVWVRGRPILGFVSGLLMGLGFTVALQQFGFYPLNLVSAIVAPLLTAVLGAWRGWRGCAWKVG